jgi:16S rRNA (uracil1498-N3)-methyltransferase
MRYAKIRLYSENLQNEAQKEVVISTAQAHYLTKVMRLREGAEVSIFNAKVGEFAAAVSSVKNILFLHKKVREPVQVKENKLALAFAPIKNPGAGFIIQKATELGVDEIYPVLTQRTVVDKVNLEKLKLIAIEAAEQCGRLSLPIIHPLQNLKNFIGNFPLDASLLLADETGAGIKMSNCDFKKINCILIGPEGGFSSSEREMLKTLPALQKIDLGENILRAETAAIAAIASYQVINGK